MDRAQERLARVKVDKLLPNWIIAHTQKAIMTIQHVHAWTHPISIAYMPGDTNTTALDLASSALLDWLRDAGCTITIMPDNRTDLIVTTRCFGDNVSREEALFFNAKRQYHLSSRPQVLTLVDVPEDEYQSLVRHFATIARLPEAEAKKEQYAGLGPQAADIISHQARRGGPELAFSRLVQGQVHEYSGYGVAHSGWPALSRHAFRYGRARTR